MGSGFVVRLELAARNQRHDSADKRGDWDSRVSIELAWRKERAFTKLSAVVERIRNDCSWLVNRAKPRSSNAIGGCRSASRWENEQSFSPL